MVRVYRGRISSTKKFLSARLGLADSDCVSRCFVKGSFRIVLGVHGSDFPGSEIGCFEPGNVFLARAIRRILTVDGDGRLLLSEQHPDFFFIHTLDCVAIAS
jgi:hypothetical protein